MKLNDNDYFKFDRFGFSISMMERIMTLDHYKYNKRDGYNPKYIVQLVENFRSHPSIFEFSNEEFYNSRLVSRQKEETANFAIGWNLLPNKNYPTIFESNSSESEQKLKGTSMFNQGELEIVKKYVKALLYDGINGKKVEPSDIGIISPYSAQNEKLKEIFNNGIEIGTVEYFQGREKLVIIVSCVRSQTKTVGFLSNQKRLNVSLTRAKALQIIIGNPKTLRMDKYWRKFIDLCQKKNAVIGEVPKSMMKKSVEQLENKMNHLSLNLSDKVTGQPKTNKQNRRRRHEKKAFVNKTPNSKDGESVKRSSGKDMNSSSFDNPDRVIGGVVRQHNQKNQKRPLPLISLQKSAVVDKNSNSVIMKSVMPSGMNLTHSIAGQRKPRHRNNPNRLQSQTLTRTSSTNSHQMFLTYRQPRVLAASGYRGQKTGVFGQPRLSTASNSAHVLPLIFSHRPVDRNLRVHDFEDFSDYLYDF
jgi:hypothetical protein